eukprot:TRINITY_DN10197_c0_g1_i1.p1 TRINITY_DN10197_c0_g1~~TRINITY_DN10197_c0_g1_i1.p1  ORF type:complete len:315 (-),score=55.65 TRINITY_DN10197_c0_g1_i1:99-1043(-)
MCIRDRAKSFQSPVALAISFDWPKKERPTYEVWISSSDANSYEILSRFATFGDLLEPITERQLYFVVWHCEDCAKLEYKVPRENCLSGGRYCAPDPDGSGPLTGRDVLLEDLRQHCISKLYPKEFWKYITTYTKTCLSNPLLETCSAHAMKESAINADKIKSCVESTFISDAGKPNLELSDNTVLTLNRELFMDRGITSWPQIFVNGIAYTGNFESTSIFDTICHAFLHKPTVCEKMEAPFQQSHHADDYKPKPTIWIVFGIVGCFALLFMGAFYLVYKRVVRRELSHELADHVNEAVSKYMLMTQKRVPEGTI